MGENIIIEFVDPTRSGEFRMTYDPSEKNVAAARPAAKLGATVATVQVMGTPTAEGGKAVLISVPLPQNGSHTIDVIGTITSMTPRPVQNFRKSIPGPAPLFTHFVQLGPGSYTLKVLVRDQVTGVLGTDEVVFDVK
jgi:hypothetical protein